MVNLCDAADGRQIFGRALEDVFAARRAPRRGRSSRAARARASRERRGNRDGSRARIGRLRSRLRSCRPAGTLRRAAQTQSTPGPFGPGVEVLLYGDCPPRATVPSANGAATASTATSTVDSVAHLPRLRRDGQHDDVRARRVVNVCDAVEPLLDRLAVAPVPAVADDSVTSARVDSVPLKNTGCPGSGAVGENTNVAVGAAARRHRECLRRALIAAPVDCRSPSAHEIISSRAVLMRGCHAGAARAVAEIPDVAGNHGAKTGGRRRTVEAHIRKRRRARRE